MITATYRRRLPVRASEAQRALERLDHGVAEWAKLPGSRSVDVLADRLACEVRHSITISNPSLRDRLWWLTVGRSLYHDLVEELFDDIARATGSAVRRPARLRFTPRRTTGSSTAFRPRAEPQPVTTARSEASCTPLS